MRVRAADHGALADSFHGKYLVNAPCPSDELHKVPRSSLARDASGEALDPLAGFPERLARRAQRSQARRSPGVSVRRRATSRCTPARRWSLCVDRSEQPPCARRRCVAPRREECVGAGAPKSRLRKIDRRRRANAAAKLLGSVQRGPICRRRIVALERALEETRRRRGGTWEGLEPVMRAEELPSKATRRRRRRPRVQELKMGTACCLTVARARCAPDAPTAADHEHATRVRTPHDPARVGEGADARGGDVVFFYARATETENERERGERASGRERASERERARVAPRASRERERQQIVHDLPHREVEDPRSYHTARLSTPLISASRLRSARFRRVSPLRSLASRGDHRARSASSHASSVSLASPHPTTPPGTVLGAPSRGVHPPSSRTLCRGRTNAASRARFQSRDGSSRRRRLHTLPVRLGCR